VFVTQCEFFRPQTLMPIDSLDIQPNRGAICRDDKAGVVGDAFTWLEGKRTTWSAANVNPAPLKSSDSNAAKNLAPADSAGDPDAALAGAGSSASGADAAPSALPNTAAKGYIWACKLTGCCVQASCALGRTMALTSVSNQRRSTKPVCWRF